MDAASPYALRAAGVATASGVVGGFINTDVGDDCVGEMKIKGSQVAFYMSTAEWVGKGVCLAPGRFVTGNTVQRMSYVIIYNCDKGTIKALDQAFKFGNTYISLNKVQEVLEKRGKTIDEVKRRVNHKCDGIDIYPDPLSGFVGFEIYLA